VGLEFDRFRMDVGCDERIYSFPTTNLRFQLSWAMP
jgi:hypothetical protein